MSLFTSQSVVYTAIESIFFLSAVLVRYVLVHESVSGSCSRVYFLFVSCISAGCDGFETNVSVIEMSVILVLVVTLKLRIR